jgi:hypothetical protein
MMERKVAEELLRQLDKIKKIENAVDAAHYNTEKPQDINVNIQVDNKVEHGMFKPHPTEPNTWLASEQTYRAMKKNIFALDEDMLDLADNIICESCKKTVDKQFWFFCPYCGASYK